MSNINQPTSFPRTFHLVKVVAIGVPLHPDCFLGSCQGRVKSINVDVSRNPSSARLRHVSGFFHSLSVLLFCLLR